MEVVFLLLVVAAFALVAVLSINRSLNQSRRDFGKTKVFRG